MSSTPDDVDIDLVALESQRHPAIEDFVLWLTVERGRSANTLAAYGRDLARYQAHLARRGADPLTATGEVTKMGRRLLFATGELHDAEGRLIARGNQTAIPPTN